MYSISSIHNCVYVYIYTYIYICMYTMWHVCIYNYDPLGVYVCVYIFYYSLLHHELHAVHVSHSSFSKNCHILILIEYYWFHGNHPDQQFPEHCCAVGPIWPEMTSPVQSFDDFNGSGHISLCGREEDRVIGTRHELLTWIHVRKWEWLLSKRIQSCWPQAVNCL